MEYSPIIIIILIIYIICTSLPSLASEYVQP